MEDIDANIRRNLVAVSTVILLGTYLEVPLSAVLLKWLTPDSFSIPGDKLVVIGYAALLYFGLRFRLSTSIQDLQIAEPSRVQNDRKMMFFADLLRLAERYRLAGLEHPTFRGGLSHAISEVARRKGIDETQRPAALLVRLTNQPPGEWSLSINAAVTWDRNQSGFNADDLTTEFLVTPTMFLMTWTKVRVYFRNAFYTDTGMQRDLPVFLCLGAELALAYQLARLAGWLA